MPIKYLPDEIWFLIFEYLDEFSDAFNCALINKQCNAVVTPILWREIPVSVDKLLKILLTVKLFREINNFPRAVAPGHLVRTVDCQIVDQDSVLLLLHRTPYITDISISQYLRNVSKKFVRKMLKDTLMYIPRLCPAITRLELINFFITIGFSPDSIRYLAKKCPNLESIDIFGRSFCYEYGDHVVDHSLDITDLHRIRNNIPVGIILPEEKFHANSTDEGLKDIADLERMLNRMHVDIVLSEEEYEDTGDFENLSDW